MYILNKINGFQDKKQSMWNTKRITKKHVLQWWRHQKVKASNYLPRRIGKSISIYTHNSFIFYIKNVKFQLKEFLNVMEFINAFNNCMETILSATDSSNIYYAKEFVIEFLASLTENDNEINIQTEIVDFLLKVKFFILITVIELCTGAKKTHTL